MKINLFYNKDTLIFALSKSTNHENITGRIWNSDVSIPKR